MKLSRVVLASINNKQKLLHGYNYSTTGLFMYGIPAKQLMKMYKQNSVFVAAVLTIVRNSSGPLLWKISWDTKYLDCDKRINHLHKKRAFTVITTIGDKIAKTYHQMGSFGEQKNSHPSPVPSIQRWGVCCFLQVARRAAQHYSERVRMRK